jgi:hypothetical protein
MGADKMRYEGANCPVCGVVFEGAGEDIVTCPICGTPHHRACFEETGRCANEEKHAEGFDWAKEHASLPARGSEAEPSGRTLAPGGFVQGAEARQSCPRCGGKVSPDMNFCAVCGLNLKAPGALPGSFLPPMPGAFRQAQNAMGRNRPAIQPEDELDGMTAGEMARYIRVSPGSYIPKFFRMEKMKKKVSWNWGAFFFTPYWFFYRKLMLPGLIFLLAHLAVFAFALPWQVEFQENFFALYNAQQTAAAENPQSEDARKALDALVDFAVEGLAGKYRAVALSAFATGALHILAGVAGNTLYRKKIKKEILRVRADSEDFPAYTFQIQRRGGVSLLLGATAYGALWLGQTAAIAFLPTVLQWLGWI